MESIKGMAPLPVGTRLEKYELLEVLGQGGGGITYRAVDKQLQREVAIKEHFPQGLCERAAGTAEVQAVQATAYAQSLHSFCRGARILAGVNHPGVAKVHEIFSACNTAFLVMEYVEGVPFNAWMRTRPSASRLVHVLEQLLAALGHLHSCEVIHRDIKPANILMKDEDTPVLIDFDAAMVGEPTHTLTQVGTPGYAAPEQFTPGQIPGPQSDIYALGHVFLRAAAEADVPLPRRLAATLKKACEQSPLHRYKNVEEWGRALNSSRSTWTYVALLLVALAGTCMFLFKPTVVSAPAPESAAELPPPQEVAPVILSKEHPIELVELGNDLRWRKGNKSEPELQGEKDFQNAVLTAQQETDAACQTLYDNEVKSGKMTKLQYNRKKYDLEEALNQKTKALVEAYIKQTFAEGDPQPRRTHSVFDLLEIRKMRVIAAQARDYPLHPHDLVTYRWGRLVRPQKEPLPPREEAFVERLLAAQKEYDASLADGASDYTDNRIRFNKKVAQIVTDYLLEHFDENYLFNFYTKPVLKNVLSQGITKSAAMQLLAEYPFVFDNQEEVHSELNGDKRLLKMSDSPNQGEDYTPM